MTDLNQTALDAATDAFSVYKSFGSYHAAAEAIIRAYIDALPVQEPVAWLLGDDDASWFSEDPATADHWRDSGRPIRALYADPSPRVADLEAELAKVRRFLEISRQEGLDALERVEQLAKWKARAETAETELATVKARLAEAERQTKEANERANLLAEVIRDCPDAKTHWGKKMLEEDGIEAAVTASENKL